MATKTISVLLVEDDPDYAHLLRVMLGRKSILARFKPTHVYRLSEAVKLLGQEHFDVILLDLTLPDAEGMDTIERAQAAALELPIIVLTGLDDETLAVEAVKSGAQDYLIKGQMNPNLLARAITYAIERKRAQVEQNRHIQRLALLRDVDRELTRRLDVHYVLAMALDAAVRLSGAHAGLIGLLEAGRTSLQETIGYGAQPLSDAVLLESGVIARCLRQRKAQLVTDVTFDPDYTALNPETRALIAAPLLSSDRLLGYLNVETGQPDRFTGETFEFLTLLAARIAAAVDNAQLYQTSQRQVVELQELYAQVSTLEQLKTDIIHIAAHDLRTPLMNIKGFAHMLHKTASTDLTPQQNDFLARIQESVERMQAIINNILSLQRIESDQGLRLRKLNLSKLVKKAFGEHQEQARQKNQDFSLHMPDAPLHAQGDSALLYEAIANLINNAIKYTPDNGRVAICLTTMDGWAVFEVEDTGYGVPPEEQPRLFQPFFRAKSRETAEIDGTGLGLNLVKNIIERHGGAIRFESHYGEGSTFGFQLPLTEEEA